jgi:hypothetical protein
MLRKLLFRKANTYFDWREACILHPSNSGFEFSSLSLIFSIVLYSFHLQVYAEPFENTDL